MDRVEGAVEGKADGRVEGGAEGSVLIASAKGGEAVKSAAVSG